MAGVVIPLVIFLVISCAAPNLLAQSDTSSFETSGVTLVPPLDLLVTDHKYDHAGQIDLSWSQSPDDVNGAPEFIGYVIERSVDGGPFEKLDETLPMVVSYADKDVVKTSSYSYRVGSKSSSESSPTSSFTSTSAAISPETEWFDGDSAWEFILLILVCGSVIYFIYSARKGKSLFLRKIAGLDAVEEAIGRATEMGRPILFIPGIHDMDDVQTIAGMTILARVAKQVAEYETRIFVPTRASLAMTAARETVREAYITAGKLDAYRQDDIFYVTDEQFAYVAAVNGIMIRDKPATCFYLGAFFAESLILAETGHSIGAIQIAGTAMPAQLPFFIAACDYTLIGEELFAASAYLSGDPKQMGSLKGQDVGKVIGMVAIIIGVVLATLATDEALGMGAFKGAYNFVLTVFSAGGG